MKSEYLDAATVRRLRSQLSGAEWLPLRVSLETGLRIGDVVALPRSAVKPDGLHYTAAKTGKRGVAHISAALRRDLPTRGKWLFPSPTKRGQHLTRQACWYRMKRAAARSGVDLCGVSPHSLRKVFAVEIYREKGFKAAQEALQHSNAATTEIYAFADWSTGENAEKPLTRGDLRLIIQMCLEALGEYDGAKKRGGRS